MINNQYSKKYSFDKNFFKNPNISNCYIAGLTASDGCITSVGNSFRWKLTIQERDEKILETCKKEFQYNGPILTQIKTGNRSTQKQLCVCGIQNSWQKDLINNWNIGQRKSLTLGPPNIDNTELCLAYIVGIIDGDGSIFLSKVTGQNKKQLHFSIIGTRELLDWIRTKLKLIEDIKYKNVPNIYKGHGNCFSLTYKANRALAILKILMLIKTPYKLERKWNKVKEYEKN